MMGMRGPAPTCRCGDTAHCATCRRREVARRCYHGEPPLNPLHFRPASVRLSKDPATLGYIAGPLDGEGCLTRSNGRWKVQIAMTDESVIRWLGEIGGTVRERSVKGNRQRCWRWLLMRQADVHAFLTALLPLLRIKQALAASVVLEIATQVPDELLALELAA